jgi:hypothetical protein
MWSKIIRRDLFGKILIDIFTHACEHFVNYEDVLENEEDYQEMMDQLDV